MEKEVKTTDTPKKIRPFSVMDQMVAHRLAMEGFEIINVIPSNKYADEAHFIFNFNANSAFKKRFKEILAEVESKTAQAAADHEMAVKETSEKVAAVIAALEAENAELKAKLSEKITENDAKIDEKSLKTDEKCAKSAQKTAKNVSKMEKQDEISELDIIMDKLADLEALNNCILSNVAALNFYNHMHPQQKEG